MPQAVQTEGAPGFGNISRTPASTSWVLQERVNLTSGIWSNSASGTNNPVVVPAALPKKFYRLHKP